jgi:TonB family protein
MARLTRVALPALLTIVASAQPHDTAHALLQDIATSVRAAKSWRAEGVKIDELTAPGIHVLGEIHFHVAVNGSYLRWESKADASEAEGDLTVCDGADHWTYHSPGVVFDRNAIGVSPCVEPPILAWDRLSDNLLSATVIGHYLLQFRGGLRECEVVSAEYAAPEVVDNAPALSRTARTMCIDTSNKFILRDHLELAAPGSGAYSSTTITYSNYERNPELPRDTFQFQVPTGTFQDPGPYLDRDDPVAEDGVYRMGGNVGGPQLIYNTEPSYTPEARKAGISGIVLLSLIVDADGKPRNVSVVRGLDHSLDEKALEVVQTWRFRAGMRHGVPVAVGGIVVAVSFRLP